LAGLIKEHFRILRLPSDLKDPLSKITRMLSEMESSKELVAVVEGRQISRMLEAQPEELATYCSMLLRATSVIFCRSSPK
jgi:magnesium-transporting ATPase (P-type)